MPIRNRLWGSFLLILVLAPGLFAQSSMEAPVRLTYAKLIFANQVGIIEANLMFKNAAHPTDNIAQVLRDGQLTVQLSHFQPGTIMGNTAPLQSLASDWGDKPAWNIATQTNTFKGLHGEQWREDSVARMLADTGSKTEPGTLEHVIGDMNTLVPKDVDPRRWTKYIGYDAVVTYQGSEVSYHASFLFTDDNQVLILEPYLIGRQNLEGVNVYPEVLLHRLGSNAAVAEWVKANMAPAGEGKSGELFCDLATLRCLLPVPASAVR